MIPDSHPPSLVSEVSQTEVCASGERGLLRSKHVKWALYRAVWTCRNNAPNGCAAPMLILFATP